jgi:hypothetical protein
MFSLLSFLALLGLLVLAALASPAAAYAAVLCLFGIKQWGQSTTHLFSQQLPTFVNYAVGLIVLVSAARQWLKDQADINKYGIVWVLICCLYSYAYISSFWAPVPILTPRIVVMQWIAWSPYVLVIAIASPFLIIKVEDVVNFSKWAILVGGLTCALALFFGRWGYRGLLVEGVTRADVWNETNPLALATLGGSVAICGLIMSFYEDVRYKKYLFLIVIPLGVSVIIRSGSRGQLLSLVLALLIGLPSLLRKNSGSGVSGLLIAFAAVVVVTDIIFTQGLISGDYKTMTDRWSVSESSEAATGRFEMANVILNKATSDPLALVAGIGNSGSFAFFDIYTHIAPLEIFAEEGLFGFGIYIAIFVLTYKNFRKLIEISNTGMDSQLHQSIAVLWILFLFEFFLSCKQGTLLSSIYVFAYAGMLDRLVNRINVEKPVTGENESLVEKPIKPENLMV